MNLRKTLLRCAGYNILLIMFCIIKYLMDILFFYRYSFIFSVLTTMLMLCFYMKIFSWKKRSIRRFSVVYLIYVIVIVSIYFALYSKLQGVIMSDTIYDLLIYNITQFSAWIFIMYEPCMVIIKD